MFRDKNSPNFWRFFFCSIRLDFVEIMFEDSGTRNIIFNARVVIQRFSITHPLETQDKINFSSVFDLDALIYCLYYRLTIQPCFEKIASCSVSNEDYGWCVNLQYFNSSTLCCNCDDECQKQQINDPLISLHICYKFEHTCIYMVIGWTSFTLFDWIVYGFRNKHLIIKCQQRNNLFALFCTFLRDSPRN